MGLQVRQFECNTTYGRSQARWQSSNQLLNAVVAPQELWVLPHKGVLVAETGRDCGRPNKLSQAITIAETKEPVNASAARSTQHAAPSWNSTGRITPAVRVPVAFCLVRSQANMTSSSVADPAKPARRCQGLFLIPIGRENEHQRTIDGLLPAKVSPSAVTSALLPCWGVTDGNYLVKNRVRAQAGDVFALIRAQQKGQTAYVHRLAVVEKIVRDTSACAELYKTSHDYNMGRSCQLG